MQVCKVCNVEKDFSCYSPSKTSRSGYNYTCKPCRNEQRRKQYHEDPAVNASKAEYRRENSEKYKEYMREYREQNKDILLAKRREPEQLAHKKEIDRAYSQANPDKICAKSAKRRAWRLKATPKWANQERIQALYTKAKEMQKETGIEYHLDHMVPLNSRFVSGLHCEHNLQILPGSENCQKSNLWWPDMPDRLDYKELLQDYKKATAHHTIEIEVEVAEFTGTLKYVL